MEDNKTTLEFNDKLGAEGRNVEKQTVILFSIFTLLLFYYVCTSEYAYPRTTQGWFGTYETYDVNWYWWLALLGIIICGAIVIYNMVFTFDKVNQLQRKKEIEDLLPYRIKTGDLSSFQQVMNLSSKSNTLDVFSYSDSMVFIKMKNGQQIMEHIDKITCRFDYYVKGNYRTVNVKSPQNNLSIQELNALMSERDWDTIFTILTKAGKTYNAVKTTSAYRNKKLSIHQISKGTKTAVKLINILGS